MWLDQLFSMACSDLYTDFAEICVIQSFQEEAVPNQRKEDAPDSTSHKKIIFLGAGCYTPNFLHLKCIVVYGTDIKNMIKSTRVSGNQNGNKTQVSYLLQCSQHCTMFLILKN